MNERDREMYPQYDGRNPYGSRGGYVVSSRGRGRGRRGRRGDRAMDYGYMPHYDGRMMPHGDGETHRYIDPRADYRYEDMHHGGGRTGGYEPVEFMGYCNGYYGTPDHGYRGERDYGYDMRGRRDYGYDYRDYGDFGETLSDEELRKWEHALMSELDDRERQMFNKDAIMQKAKQMGRQMEGFGEKELYVATLMCYTDYKHTIGQNPDMAMKLAYDWLSDKDVAVKGAEKLAIYYDCIVEGE